MEKERVREFIYFTQFQKKLPLPYFFLTKEFLIFVIVMYFLSSAINVLVFSLIVLMGFAYVVREYFHYKTENKYNLPVLAKIIRFIKEKDKKYELRESKDWNKGDKQGLF